MIVLAAIGLYIVFAVVAGSLAGRRLRRLRRAQFTRVVASTDHEQLDIAPALRRSR